MYHKTPVSALWLEEGDLVSIQGYGYEVSDMEYDGDDEVEITLLDEEGFVKSLTLSANQKVTVLMWVDEEAVI
jgi:hypothetical protein